MQNKAAHTYQVRLDAILSVTDMVTFENVKEVKITKMYTMPQSDIDRIRRLLIIDTRLANIALSDLNLGIDDVKEGGGKV